MSIPLESVFNITKSPRLIIEASAGTGKTFTIVGLYVRLLIEENLNVDEILVVTFTKKATAELRERILERLRACLTSLKNGEPGEDPFLKELHAWVDDQKEATERIRNAIHDFDDSQVFTIHGFCQKVLKEEALISGTSFEMELDQSDTLLHQAAEDFWRVFIDTHSGTEAGRYYISKLMKVGKTPAELINNLYPMFSKPYAQTEGEVMDDPVQYLARLQSLKQQMVDVWGTGNGDILSILENCDVKRYAQHFETRLNKLNNFLEDTGYSSDEPADEAIKYFTTDYLCDENNILKNGNPTAEHPFFDLCNQYKELVEGVDIVKNTIIKEAVEDIKRRREKLISNSSIVTYDDLLIKLNDALEDEISGDDLASILRKKYPFALVDEFQDTDPIQYSIFDQIYPSENTNTSLMMIGDPKQAIYAFRGADVYTYIQARKAVSGGKYSLEKNYRSTPKLIDAVNTLFDGDHVPFIEGEIEFSQSKHGIPELAGTFLLDGNEEPPMKIFYGDGVSKKEESKDFVFRGTVQQIYELLEKSKKGRAVIDGKKLVAGDIAILVSKHEDAEELKKMLKSVGIGAVTYSRKKVFESFEAKRLQLLLQAVLEPSNRQNVQNVLVSGFFGLDLNQIYQYQSDEELRQELLNELLDLNELWHSKGFYPMFRKLMFSKSRLLNFTSLENSERIITNLQQLADINSKAEVEGGMDPAALYRWYYKELSDPDKDDEKMLLLESDQNLVKILTIHGSKGLEFPVVFCPTLWEGREYRKGLLEEYHSGGENSDLIINYDQSDSEQRKEAMNQYKIESIAEETRKMYVAITRAKYECRIFWAAHKESHFSGLGASLLGSELVREAILSKHKLKNVDQKAEFSDQTFLEKFKNIERRSLNNIRLIEIESFELPTDRISLDDDEAIEWNFREYKGRTYLPVKKAVDSFSSLANHKSEPGEPDYDQFIVSYVDSLSTVEKEPGELSIFTFPRGATAGTLIHKLFEHEEFHFDKIGEKSRSDISQEVLERYQFDEKWAPVLDEMLANVSDAVIGDLSLNKVSQSDELREMEFNLPISPPKLETLLSIIRNGNISADPKLTGTGFLTGFIDLIVRQNGKYYILDYKSNYLGDAVEDYKPDQLKSEMEAASYDLQYHLYIVAMSKFLRKILPDFNYERDFGGAAYLFVRGMRAGSENGVWFDKPDVEIVNELEKTLDRS